MTTIGEAKCNTNVPTFDIVKAFHRSFRWRLVV
jgi:hypothetical protein